MYKVERWKKIAENELGIEILGLMKEKWELGRIDFEVMLEIVNLRVFYHRIVVKKY